MKGKKVDPAAGYIAARTAELEAAVARRELVTALNNAGKVIRITSGQRSYCVRPRDPVKFANITNEMRARLNRLRSAKAEIITKKK